MRIETQPNNAAIYINGSKKGSSPLTTELQEGTHTIEARKDGYVTKSETKTIGTQTKDQSRVETINITLEKETGSVYIQSSPSRAYIYLNGSYKGTTNKTIEGLEEGSYSLKLIKAGYKEKSQTIGVDAGKREYIKVTLEKEEMTGRLCISSEPDGASIYINGIYQGTSPKTIEELEEGYYLVELFSYGYEDKIQNVKIEKGKTENIDISLLKGKTTGSVYINSNPIGAHIYIDGNYKGTSPKEIERQKTGYYELKLTKGGYEEKTEIIRVKNGEKTILYMTLEKKETKGSIEIQTSPIGSSIYIDGKYIGTTPKTVEGLEEGTYTLKLTKSGYEDISENVKIEAGKRTTQYIIMEKEETTGSLYISSNPSGAYIYINGSYKGMSPKEIEDLEVGTYTVKLTKSGYKDKTQTIKIETGKRETEYLMLQKEEPSTYISVSNIPEQVLVKGETFQMGNTRGESEGDSDEKPVHTVKLTYDYYIGKTEITFNDYDAFCEATKKNKPSDRGWGRGNRPVINVSWNDAIGYCNWLSEKEGIAKAYDSAENLLDKYGNKTTDITKVEGYRLPTEAEWEYAARGGHKSKGDYKYAGSNNISTVAWYDGNANNKNHEVGQKTPNELGLYDMSGSVWEWCHDWYGSYTSTTKTNPTGPNSTSLRVLRGGSWFNSDRNCQVANRSSYSSGSSGNFLGFRIARTR